MFLVLVFFKQIISPIFFISRELLVFRKSILCGIDPYLPTCYCVRRALAVILELHIIFSSSFWRRCRGIDFSNIIDYRLIYLTKKNKKYFRLIFRHFQVYWWKANQSADQTDAPGALIDTLGASQAPIRRSSAVEKASEVDLEVLDAQERLLQQVS